MLTFLLGSAACVAVVVLVARVVRGRAYATFRGVMLSVYSLVATGLVGLFDALLEVFLLLHALVFVQSLVLAAPRMMPDWYRVLVTYPASFFSAGVFLGLPWALASALGFSPWGAWLPFVFAAIGLLQSLTTRYEERDLVVGDGVHVRGTQRHPPPEPREGQPFRFVQITDPHLGPFMSVKSLRAICERAVACQPDLVFITGDLLTMETQRDVDGLARAFEPLKALPGRVYACHGNHDHEAPDTVAQGLARAGVKLLVDAAELVQTQGGPVQVVGADFRFRQRAQHLEELCAKVPREAGALRILLLHDPSAFRHVPEGEADLVLSGHTHGGQVGLVSLGAAWTALQLFVRSPDHGFWARGRNRLYVHKGTGHYGFPLRVGVPAEESLLRVHFPGGSQ